jgi:hypothetical protein
LLNDVTVVENNEDHLKIMAVTWNLQGHCPDRQTLDELFQKDNVSHDMVIFASQEAVRPIAQSIMLPSKEKLNQLILDYFNDNTPLSEQFVMVNSISLAASHLIVIVRQRLAPFLSDVNNKELALGFGNVVSNKGAVCISFKIGNTRFLAINCHLEAHNEGLERRNVQWNKINDRFVLNLPEDQCVR